jgi:nucleotide-binding universal stress UspA family protein
MGTHGRGGFERLVLGSVTEQLIRKVSCPVLTVPPQLSEHPAVPAHYRAILCPIDFSPSSVRAFEVALQWAKESDARLVMLHVLESSLDEMDSEGFAHLTAPDSDRQRKDAVQTGLDALIPADARTWCRPDQRLAFGKPYRRILEVAAETGAELIVIGLHGRGAVDLAVFGSTTNHVLRGAACPVLTITA